MCFNCFCETINSNKEKFLISSLQKIIHSFRYQIIQTCLPLNVRIRAPDSPLVFIKSDVIVSFNADLIVSGSTNFVQAVWEKSQIFFR